MTKNANPLTILNNVFGYESFRKGQEPIIKKIMSGKDGVVIMPTGGGKSILYQIPALCSDGLTIVVSPLISLMKDQVDTLVKKGVKAATLNSSMSWTEVKNVLDNLDSIKLLYIAPERLSSDTFRHAISKVDINLLAIDEAHCLSQWGHDFRPEYQRLGKLRELVGNPQCVCFTATATSKVRADMKKTLDLKDPFSVMSGFARPNLSMNVEEVKKSDKLDRVYEIAKKHKKGIVYCTTTKEVDMIEDELSTSYGLNCLGYHAGRTPKDREATQNKFMSGEVDIVVATNAFGMGIDRGDLRFVVHYSICGSVEALSQEWGRAGRDGDESYCSLLFSSGDLWMQNFFLKGANPDFDLIRDVYDYFNSFDAGCVKTNEEVKIAVDSDNSMGVSTAISVLVKHGYIKRTTQKGSRSRYTEVVDTKDTRLSKIKQKDLRDKKKSDYDKLKALENLCRDKKECRQQAIMKYFGQTKPYSCGKCDNCKRYE